MQKFYVYAPSGQDFGFVESVSAVAAFEAVGSPAGKVIVVSAAGGRSGKKFVNGVSVSWAGWNAAE